MNLSDILEKEGDNGLQRLAGRVGCSPAYLGQLARNWRGRLPSPRFAWRLCAADRRIDFARLYESAKPTRKTPK